MGSVMYLSTVGMSDSWEYLDVVVPLCMMLPTGLFVMTEPFKDTIYHTYQDILKHVDPRVEDLPLMSSPLPTIALCLAFVVLVKIVGPWYMSDKPAMKFNNVLIGYNFMQVLLSAKIFYEVGVSGWFGLYDFRCQPVDYSRDPVAMRMVYATYLCYISKIVDFLDTFFFVLRKKNDQISMLHVIHHGIMPFSTWVGVKFTPGGHCTFFVLLNSFVHVWMYFYYMVAAMGPQYKRFIWWKIYLTKLQIVQFMTIMAHAFQLCFRECDFPIAFVYWTGGHSILFFGLFLNFYIQSYIKKLRKPEEKATEVKSAQEIAKLIPCQIQQNGIHENGDVQNLKSKKTDQNANNSCDLNTIKENEEVSDQARKRIINRMKDLDIL